MAARRSRTGCQTCRKRKLKCDEVRPVCGQCTKSRRECIPSDGVAFRHEQNASLNGIGSTGTLENFFKYREAFNDEQKKNFVPIPRNLTFIHITDPYAEEQNPSNPFTTPGSSYQQVAAHSLEALSTAATDHPAYGHPGQFGNVGDALAAFTSGGAGGGGGGGNNASRSGYGPAGGVNVNGNGLSGVNNPNNNINFILNHPSSATHANMIDPNLEVALGGGTSTGNHIGHPHHHQHHPSSSHHHVMHHHHGLDDHDHDHDHHNDIVSRDSHHHHHHQHHPHDKDETSSLMDPVPDPTKSADDVKNHPDEQLAMLLRGVDQDEDVTA